MKKLNLEIADEGIQLRSIVGLDLPRLLRWRNEARRWFRDDREITPTPHGEWFAQYLKRLDDWTFVIQRDGKPLGQIALYEVATVQPQLGRLIVDPAERGHRVATQATRLLLRWAFEVLRLKVIELEVKADNAPAIRLYRACGFEEHSRDTTTGMIYMRALSA